MNKQEKIISKIISGVELSRELAKARFFSKKIVFTNGCFDIIHRGHIEYLSQTADLGDKLVVGLNSDASVRKLKGKNRPIQDETTRARILASFFFVDFVVIFKEETPYNLIKTVQPDILVKGGDYKIETIVGYDIVTAHGGKVLSLPFVDGYSTTGIIEKISK
jgi:rfaE bifunctional protein nucleotidyltransferase chain/domain